MPRQHHAAQVAVAVSAAAAATAQSSDKVGRTLYKSLLRVARQFDENPGSKALIFRKHLEEGGASSSSRSSSSIRSSSGGSSTATTTTTSTTTFTSTSTSTSTSNSNSNNNNISNSSSRSPMVSYYNELLDRILGPQRSLYQPVGSVVSFVDLVRRESRTPHPLYTVSTRVDAGFAAVRTLSSIWNHYTSIEYDSEDNYEDDDMNEDDGHADGSHADTALPRGRRGDDEGGPLAAEVSLAPTMCAGMLLVAHPMLQGPLHRSVVLVIEHTTRGSYGLVINSGTDRMLKEAVKNLPDDIERSFGGNAIAFGGMVRRLAYIHNVPAVGGLPIPMCRTPYFAGGQIEKAVEFLDDRNHAKKSATTAPSSGTAAPARPVEKLRRFRFFAGCCLWDRGELQRDVDAGYWIPVCSQPDDVLSRALPSSQNVVDVGGSNSSSSSSSSSSHSVSTSNGGTGIEPGWPAPPADVWRLLLRGLGQPFAAMADLPQWINTSTVDASDLK